MKKIITALNIGQLIQIISFIIIMVFVFDGQTKPGGWYQFYIMIYGIASIFSFVMGIYILIQDTQHKGLVTASGVLGILSSLFLILSIVGIIINIIAINKIGDE